MCQFTRIQMNLSNVTFLLVTFCQWWMHYNLNLNLRSVFLKTFVILQCCLVRYYFIRDSQPHKGHLTSKTVPVLPSLIFPFHLLPYPVHVLPHFPSVSSLASLLFSSCCHRTTTTTITTCQIEQPFLCNGDIIFSSNSFKILILRYDKFEVWMHPYT